VSAALAIDLSRGDSAQARAECLAALRRGEAVVLPTETVYGLAALGSSRAVLDGIKGGRTGPYAVAVADHRAAEAQAQDLSQPARRAAARWWPGPLTLVVPAPGGGSVGLRVPGHDFTRGLLEELGEPLLLTSANLSGEPAPATVAELSPALLEAAAVVVDGGPCPLGEASTVLACGPAGGRVLRAGVLERRQLDVQIRGLVLVVCSGNTCRSPMAAALLTRALEQAAAADPRLVLPRVASAGLMAGLGAPASLGAQAAMDQMGLDLSPHRSRPSDLEDLSSFDVVLGMTPSHVEELADQVLSGTTRVELFDPAGEPVQDPFGGSIADYARCANMLAEMAERRARALLPAG
jgi:protein-tyrosine phosphatase